MSCLCSETQHIWDVPSTCLCRCHSEENRAFANDFSSGTVTRADRIATSAMTSSCKHDRIRVRWLRFHETICSAKASAIAAVSSFISIESYHMMPSQLRPLQPATRSIKGHPLITPVVSSMQICPGRPTKLKCISASVESSHEGIKRYRKT